mmetsp:Transcript_30358/g.55002  ORF Transcript_30358/g.55002 Transcript_30358/m.55002 type:complete len:502 (+) Transcript_30358:111-1616(+)|eukprot:CAMPEP_0201868120 /NCGR_PEP_ID=MMETSP0902-20130614/2138_1 /ASSEMBLY_ACC=CAM_ASM_000551 /TAXON_ID=420261 /ORGANISM="Thalassiosira antarctica, Strain CCMP982" /LENGTH=501 /DNA_ID=CAMNT_0048393425 /DNA_START=89 /DNA_END=1594 /DNA_ORIENTATION=-
MERVLPEAARAGIEKMIEFAYSFEPYFAPTVVLVPGFVKEAVESLSQQTGQDVETLEYLLGMFLCYPLGMIMLSLPHGKVKHLFSFILGAFLLQFTIGIQWIHQLISSMLVYVMFLVLPAKTAKTLVPIFMMAYITAGHLHRQYINYLGWDMDFTGPQMVLTMKLYSLAYNLYDGELINKGKEDRAAKKCASVAVHSLPGIIEYLGYTFCFATVLAGPAYEYKFYANACDGSLLYDKSGKPKGKIPSQVWATVRPLLGSLLCLGIFVAGSGMYPLLDPSDPQNATPVVISEEMLAKPAFKRFAYSWLALFFIRFKYYFAWKNAEGANNIWYAGFEGFDAKGEPKGWEVSNNIDVIEFETAPNLKTLSAAWNKKTANWLAKYVYIRTGGSLFATYGMSAFWHGFYPGYYIFFMSVPLIAFCERMGRKKLSPRFDDGKKWGPYAIVCRVVTSLIVQYMIQPFQLLAFDWAVVNWKNYYFSGHIACVVFYLVVSNLPTPKKKEA